MSKLNKTPKQRFEEKFIPVPESGCWLWTAGLGVGGYGQFYLEWPTPAHRASYMLYKGEIPEGMYILHKCDVKCCVNPDHLFVGTHSDNMKDYADKRKKRLTDTH
jgi:hypothetical protein